MNLKTCFSIFYPQTTREKTEKNFDRSNRRKKFHELEDEEGVDQMKPDFEETTRRKKTI
jgi:hypothetical protein